VPELPEVETIRRTLEPLIIGRRIEAVHVARRDLRWPIADDFETRLGMRTIAALGRRAKYLLAHLDDGRVWVVHFGMSGTLLHEAGEAAERSKHDHVVVVLEDAGRLVFNDPRRFGSMSVRERDDAMAFDGVGPEPLDEKAFSGAYLFAQGRRTKRSLKDVLMDQRVVAGLGNIYVNEALFLAGLRPKRALRRTTRAECDRLAEAVRAVVVEAIEHRGTTISDFLDGIGRRGGYQWRRRVYDRGGEPCSVCASPIKVIVVGQRSSFYCPSCQH
jgi:formamidopyrimidine-DNA glycosylase